MVVLDGAGTWEYVGILRIDSKLAHNWIEVPVNSLELLDTVIELGGN